MFDDVSNRLTKNNRSSSTSSNKMSLNARSLAN